MRQVHALLNTGYREVVDADLSGYFDSIPHAELLTSVARRISDRHVLRLIKMWLVAPVEEIDERGRKHRTTRNKDEGRGCPQGAPVSPLLANLYMRRFILGWKVLGHEQRLRARIVSYADDFVICCRGSASEALVAMQDMMRRLKLAVNGARRGCAGCRTSRSTSWVTRWAGAGLSIRAVLTSARVRRGRRSSGSAVRSANRPAVVGNSGIARTW